MINKNRQFLIKVSQLPDEVSFYYSSEALGLNIDSICNKYGFKTNSGDELEYFTINNFNFSNLEQELKNNYKLEEAKAKELAVDFLGMIFLPIDNYLKEVNIAKEIEKRGGNVKNYSKYKERFIDEMEDAGMEILEELIKKHKELVNPEEEEKVVFELFKDDLAHILRDSSTESLQSLNSGLIYLLFNKENFIGKINKILLANPQKLSYKKFILDGKPARPTIANWLKDFIKENGSGIFSNIVLSKYITSSANAKLLDDNEKRLLKKLLHLYRNLKFFPDSLKNIPPEKWEIIPIERDGERAIQDNSGQQPSSTPKPKEDNRLEGLRLLASRYPEGSLERRAVEEEIGKLGKIDDR